MSFQRFGSVPTIIRTTSSWSNRCRVWRRCGRVNNRTGHFLVQNVLNIKTTNVFSWDGVMTTFFLCGETPGLESPFGEWLERQLTMEEESGGDKSIVPRFIGRSLGGGIGGQFVFVRRDLLNTVIVNVSRPYLVSAVSPASIRNSSAVCCCLFNR